jgi:hypothetical protein
VKNSAILKKTRKLIEGRGRWAQDYSSYTEDGRICESFEKEAFSFCLAGAVEKVVGKHKTVETPMKALADTIVSQGYKAFKLASNLDIVVSYNDHKGRSKRQVLAVLDKTIKRLVKEKK